LKQHFYLQQCKKAGKIGTNRLAPNVYSSFRNHIVYYNVINIIKSPITQLVD